jgi:uncharacterized protein (TIGR02266 family)
MEQENPVVNPADRRVYPRSPVVVREARATSENKVEVFFGYAQNISRSGLFISTSKRRNTGEIFTIEFTLPGVEKRFCCQARVVWVRTYRSGCAQAPGFGLQFMDLSEEDACVVERWVEETIVKQ